METETHIPLRQRLAYALPAFALAAVWIPVYVHLPRFYTDVVGMDLSVLGMFLVFIRLLDGIVDPVIGFISDHTRTKFGRRRPYIAGAALPLAVVVWLLFAPPALEPRAAAWWFGLWSTALFVFWSLILVPYEALGAELSFRYHERTALLGMRDGFMLLGTTVAAAMPSILTCVLGLEPGHAGERVKLLTMALVYGVLIVALNLWCFLEVRERSPSEVEQPAPHPSRVSSRGTWRTGIRVRLTGFLRNRPFLVLLFSYSVGAVGSNLPATLGLYYTTYVLRSIRSDLFLLLYFVVGVAFLPAWIALARHLGKKRTYLTALAVNTLGFASVFFLGEGDDLWFAVLVAVSGSAFGATYAIPSAMQADVIDYDELITGERREGQYMGLWAVARSIAAALGVGVALPILGAVGYVPNAHQTPEVLLTLRILYAVVPCVCNIAAFILALAYPITHDVHVAIRSAILQRNAGRTAVDPLGRRLST